MSNTNTSMPKSMLIDAIHPEETRVAIVENKNGGFKLSELDLEYSGVSQIKSNIYLAKVTRVEPSLQAAFVEFGNEKQGFLPFSEIHPDYFKVPVADKEALLAEQQAVDEEDEDSEEEEEVSTQLNEEEEIAEQKRRYQKLSSLKRKYKIQEVIKKHQIMLVQIVKEERGNKGAALTTYLSVAGRYCVLMPNSHQVGGISKKTSDPKERKRIKDIVQELEVPNGISLIIRTAGTGRTKAEIKRDYEYLLKLWDTIRKDTMQSTAPSLIYEEGDLVKKALRDLYTRDVETVQVAGDEAYKKARDLMKLMIPSHVRRIHAYKDPVIPLFTRYGVESQLDNIYDPVVQLPSGGYLVMNQTEALVAVDVNSGKANKERNIEETALATNKEAAVELARQLRLRDLAGLVVVDFIDMDDRRNNRIVEQLLKDALKKDRARIQLGRISIFGLLEMSRQRLRSSVAEMSTQSCPNCKGSGQRLSVQAQALRALRTIEEEGVHNRTAILEVQSTPELGLYILNEKRDTLASIETRYHLKVIFTEGTDLPAIGFILESKAALTREQQEEYKTEAHDELAVLRNNNKHNEEQDAEKNRKRSRRGRRRPNGNKSEEQDSEAKTEAKVDNNGDKSEKPASKPKSRRRRRPAKAKENEAQTEGQTAENNNEVPQESSEQKPVKVETEQPAKSLEQPVEKPKSVQESSPADNQQDNNDDNEKSRKRGWWNKG